MNIKILTRWTTLAALFLVPLFSAIVMNSYFFPFITGKAFYFRILVEVAFAGWVILAFMDAKYRPKLNALTIAVTVFTLVVLVADLLGVNPIRSIWSNFERMEGWVTIFHLWMFFMAIVYTFGSGEEGRVMWHRWFLWSLLVAFYVAFRGALQWAGKLPIEQSSSRPDSTLGNAAYLAIYMLIHVFVAIHQFISTHERRREDDLNLHWMYVALAIFFSAIIFSTATRGAILGLAGALIVTLALYAIFAKKEATLSRSICGALIGVIILTGGVIWLNRHNPKIANNETLGRLTSISYKEFQREGRYFVWPMALKGFTQRPILGWGQENFNYIFNANYNPGMYGQEQWFDRAHSVFLDWLVASGLVGLLAYLSLYVLFLVVVWRSHISVAAKSILTGLLAGYAGNNIFVFDNLGSYVFFFALLGFAAAVLSSEKEPVFADSEISSDAVSYVVAPIVLVVLAAGVYFANIVPVQANTALISAVTACQGGKPNANLFRSALEIGSPTANQEIREQLLSCAGPVLGGQYSNKIKNDFYLLSQQVIGDQIAYAPKDARGYTLAGSFWNSLGQYELALPLLEKAHLLSPEKQTIDFDLAMAYINKGKPDKALDLLKYAYESAKEYTQARIAYAAALILTGKEADAQTKFAEDKEVWNSATIAQVYMSLKQYKKAIAIYAKLADASPGSFETRAQLAQAQYTALMYDDAISTLNKLSTDFPDYTNQIKSVIKEIEKKRAGN